MLADANTGRSTLTHGLKQILVSATLAQPNVSNMHINVHTDLLQT